MSESPMEDALSKITGVKPLSPDDIAEQLRNEENTKKVYITPILEARWPGQDRIVMEYYVNDGRITVDEYGIAHRVKPKKLDYLLLFHQNIPLAVVEAKGRDHWPMKATSRRSITRISYRSHSPMRPMGTT